MGRLNLDNEISRDEKTSDLKSQTCEMDIDPLSTEKHNEDTVRNIPGLDDFMDMDYLINGRENKNGDSVTPYTIPSSDIELSEKEIESYTDKSVMECELSEMIACFKEAAYNVVKDICIDERVISLSNNLIENGKVDSKLRFQKFDLDLNSDVTKEKVDSLSPILNEMKPLVEHNRTGDVASQYDSNNMLKKGEGNNHAKDETVHANNEIAQDVSDEKVVPVNMLLLQNWDTRSSYPVSSNYEDSESQQQSGLVYICGSKNMLQKGKGHIDSKDEKVVPEIMLLLQKLDTEISQPVSSNFDGDEGQQQSEQGTSKEAISANSAVSSVAKEFSNSNHANSIPFDSKVESRSKTFEFDSPTPETSGGEESTQNAGCQQPLQTIHASGLEDGTLDSLTSSSRSFFIQDDHGESSYSVVGPLSGPIADSGIIPYSGSISLRSDSSTTSTHSFAFPILQSEWNSSPVKMVKADRRHFRKYRGWKLLCCRF